MFQTPCAQSLVVEDPHHTSGPLPPVFCWTKIGVEAGQDLSTILRRKEMERLAGNGLFAWGIGNALGSTPAHAQEGAEGGEIDVFFTRMKSAAKAADVNPSQVVLWRHFIGISGAVTELPRHMLVTSRGGAEKTRHYALLCRSETGLFNQAPGGVVDAARARNLLSRNPIGASQVTSIVSYEMANEDEAPLKPYPVAFKAKLVHQGFISLVNPVAIEGDLARLYQSACSADDPTSWLARVEHLRAAVDGAHCNATQRELFS